MSEKSKASRTSNSESESRSEMSSIYLGGPVSGWESPREGALSTDNCRLFSGGRRFSGASLKTSVRSPTHPHTHYLL